MPQSITPGISSYFFYEIIFGEFFMKYFFPNFLWFYFLRLFCDFIFCEFLVILVFCEMQCLRTMHWKSGVFITATLLPPNCRMSVILWRWFRSKFTVRWSRYLHRRSWWFVRWNPFNHFLWFWRVLNVRKLVHRHGIWIVFSILIHDIDAVELYSGYRALSGSEPVDF